MNPHPFTVPSITVTPSETAATHATPELFRITDDHSIFRYGSDPRTGISPGLGFGNDLESRSSLWRNVPPSGFDFTAAIQAMLDGENFTETGCIALVTRPNISTHLNWRMTISRPHIRLWQISTEGATWETHFSLLRGTHIAILVLYQPGTRDVAAAFVHRTELMKIFQFGYPWPPVYDDMWFAVHSIPSSLVVEINVPTVL